MVKRRSKHFSSQKNTQCFSKQKFDLFKLEDICRQNSQIVIQLDGFSTGLMKQNLSFRVYGLINSHILHLNPYYHLHSDLEAEAMWNTFLCLPFPRRSQHFPDFYQYESGFDFAFS